MPRKARVIVPNTPHHIVQRGHNRNAVFVQDEDYRYYLETLEEWKSELAIKIYGYCLMTNHIHLIVGANDRPGDIGRLMKRLAGRQTRYVNKMEGRTGSLWESRYKISPIETGAYLLQCCRYVELNPVKAKMVKRPEDYPWSSYSAKVGLTSCSWLDIDPCYKGLAETDEKRIKRYRDFVNSAIDAEGEQDFISAAIERNQLTGTRKFIEEVERRMGIRVEFRGRGRPAKKERENKSCPYI